MRKTYIATTQEAKALHDGTQTAIIVKHSNKPPYAIGQEVVAREAWQQEANYIDTSIGWGWEATDNYLYKADGNELPNDSMCFSTWRSPATMPVSAARTRFRIVSCEAVRIKDFEEEQILAWDNNAYVFYYKIEKICH
jgi:hypothetical protein